MLRRITTFSLGLTLLAGCGNESLGQTSGSPSEPSTVPAAITQADAEAVFTTLGDLDDAWKHKDCAKIAYLTTWAESTLGGAVCEAARNGRDAPGFGRYRDAEFFLPGAVADGEDGAWFAVLARHPKPAYFVFVQSEGRWCLGAGPIPVVGDEPELKGDVKDAGEEPGTALRARLVPTRHVAFLTDPAGVSGVKFSSGDPVRDLLGELVRAPDKVRPDRLSTDVRFEGPARALALPDGAALVFHVVRLVYTQKPGSGRSSLAHSRYGMADVRAFTGTSKLEAITGSELVLLATRVSKDSSMTTVGMRRALAEITADTSG